MSLLKTCILALSAITANAWDAAEKEAALKVVDECARGVQWWIFQSVADRIADERRRASRAPRARAPATPRDGARNACAAPRARPGAARANDPPDRLGTASRASRPST